MRVTSFVSVTVWACLPFAISAKTCNADNCARAATGTLGGSQAARLAACSSFQLCTATPAIVTTIVNCPTSTPTYAGPSCTSSGALTSRYASACSCAGITKSTSTYTPAPPVAIQTNFALISGKGPTGRFIDMVYPNPDDPSMTAVNPGPVLQLQPAGVLPVTRFRLGGPGDELKLADDTLRAAFFFDVGYAYRPNSIPISSVYMNAPASQQDMYGYEYAPLSCSFGDFDPTVPGYPLNCFSPTQAGLTSYYDTDNSVLSLGMSTEKFQHPIAQVYAVVLPTVAVTVPKGLVKKSKMAPDFD